MRVVSVIEDKTYLLWQQEIQLRNLKELGQKGIVVILHKGNPSEYAKSLSSLGEIYFYYNDSPVQSYLPSNKAWGLYKLLTDHPYYGKNLLLVDSDVLVRRMPRLPSSMSFGANCDNYLGYSYMRQHLTDEQITDVLCGIIPLERVKKLKGVGAQYFFHDIDARLCLQVAVDSLRIYERMKIHEASGSKIQVWTAEMWSWLWNVAATKGIECHEELDFTWATSPATEYETKNFLHLAGVTNKSMGMFYKGLYTISSPWESRDHSYINKLDTCAWVYFKEMCRLKGISAEDLINGTNKV